MDTFQCCWGVQDISELQDDVIKVVLGWVFADIAKATEPSTQLVSGGPRSEHGLPPTYDDGTWGDLLIPGVSILPKVALINSIFQNVGNPRKRHANLVKTSRSVMRCLRRHIEPSLCSG